MASESVSLRAKMSRFTGTRRVGLSSSGFGLIDTLLALFISATLIAPVMGGILIVLKTAPSAASDSVISGQQVTNRQNFELNLTSAQMRNDWSEATIVKTPPRTFNSDVGLDCVGGEGSVGDNSSTKLVVALQVRSFADVADVLKNSKGTGVLKSQGLTRVVYSRVPTEITPDGQLYDVVRRECAVKTDGEPELGEVSPNNIPSNANPPGQIPADHGGWRLKPGNFARKVLVIGKSQNAPSSGEDSEPVCFPDTGVIPDGPAVGQQRQVDWCPTQQTVLTSVKFIEPSEPCNGIEYFPPVLGMPDKGQFGYASEGGYPAYNPRCDLNFTVTFGDDRKHKIRLYQGFGS